MAESLANRPRRCEHGFARSHEGVLPLFAKVAEQGSLAHVINGQHPHEVAVLDDGQGPEPALLQDAVAVCEEVGVGRDRGELRLHQVADGGVAVGGVGRGHDLFARDDADEISILVKNGEVLLVAVDDGVEDLAEVVVGRYGLGSALGTHYVRDGEPAHLLPLADQLGLAARAEEDEEADDGEQEVVAEEPEEDKEDGEALSYGRRDIRGTHGPEARGEQPAQHTATVHREGRDQVEDHERDVDSTQRGEDLAQRSYAREYIRRDRDVAPEEQGKPEEYRGEHYVDERPRYGDLHLVDGSLWQRLHPGKPAYGQERDVLDLAPEAYGHQRVAVLVEQHAEEQRDHYADGDERVHQAAGVPEREVAEEGQEQEEAPMDFHVYAESASYLEGSTH